MITLIAFWVAFPTTALAASQYASDDPKDCKIIGDANIYGLGIRLGYYLQFIAAVFSPYFAPQQLSNICLAFSAVTLASFAAVYENASQGAFVVVDWHITVVLTMVLAFATFMFNPGLREVTIPETMHPVQAVYPTWTGGKIKKSFYGPLGALSLLMAMHSATGPWMQWKGKYQGSKDECNVYFYLSLGVFAFWVNIYNHKWVVPLKILSILGVFLGLYLLVCAIVLLLYAGLIRITSEPKTQPAEKWMKGVYTFIQLFTGGWVVAIIELTLKRNKVDVSGTPITSSGQLIPLLVGILSLLNVFLAYFRDLFGNIGKVPVFEAYVDFISRTATQVERVFGMKESVAHDGTESVTSDVELVEQSERPPSVSFVEGSHAFGDQEEQSSQQHLLSGDGEGERVPIWKQFAKTDCEPRAS